MNRRLSRRHKQWNRIQVVFHLKTNAPSSIWTIEYVLTLTLFLSVDFFFCQTLHVSSILSTASAATAAASSTTVTAAATVECGAHFSNHFEVSSRSTLFKCSIKWTMCMHQRYSDINLSRVAMKEQSFSFSLFTYIQWKEKQNKKLKKKTKRRIKMREKFYLRAACISLDGPFGCLGSMLNATILLKFTNIALYESSETVLRSVN